MLNQRQLDRYWLQRHLREDLGREKGLGIRPKQAATSREDTAKAQGPSPDRQIQRFFTAIPCVIGRYSNFLGPQIDS